jgi:hypothetical protein
MGFHHSILAEIGEVLRDFDLGGVEDFLKMADAKRAIRQEMQNAEPRFIAEAFVNFEQLHGL